MKVIKGALYGLMVVAILVNILGGSPMDLAPINGLMEINTRVLGKWKKARSRLSLSEKRFCIRREFCK